MGVGFISAPFTRHTPIQPSPETSLHLQSLSRTTCAIPLGGLLNRAQYNSSMSVGPLAPLHSPYSCTPLLSFFASNPAHIPYSINHGPIPPAKFLNSLSPSVLVLYPPGKHLSLHECNSAPSSYLSWVLRNSRKKARGPTIKLATNSLLNKANKSPTFL